MSKYEEHKTVFSDGALLVEALKEFGFDPERHKMPVHLTGYRGDARPEIANIVIPRNQISNASNDIGFIRENGKYRAIISEYDQRSPLAKGTGRPGYDQTWLNRLSQTYREKEAFAIAKERGYQFVGRTVTANGKVQLKFEVSR